MENMHQSELSAKIEEIEGLTKQVEDLQSRNEKLTGDIEELREK
jgi:archaellum component FlaC